MITIIFSQITSKWLTNFKEILPTFQKFYHLFSFIAETVKASPYKPDCYISTLKINGAHPTDSHTYELRLSNQHGVDSHTVRLAVQGTYVYGLGKKV